MENENLENKIEKHSIYDFTRKSVVGAMYRVGASFAMDAVYLSLVAAGTYYASEKMDSLESMARGFSDFVHTLDIGKLMRVAGFVVGINFIDYKFDVTNRLDGLTKKAQKLLSRNLGVEKRKHQKLYLELKNNEPNSFTIRENIKTLDLKQFQERCNEFLPAKLVYIKTHDNAVCKSDEGIAKDYEELENFFNKSSDSYNFLEYFHEIDDSYKEKMENRFSFKAYNKYNEGKLWIVKDIFNNDDEEICLIEKI